MPNYMYFILSVAALIVGYIVYGTLVTKIFGARPERPTPCDTHADGVDYVKMSTWKVWLIQLLNIAGAGPVFGPIMGALWGPAALLWIVIGCIFAGGVHDYMVGMLSVRYNGANVPNIVGYNLGNFAKQTMRVFSIVLLMLVGVIFVSAPAGLLATLTPDSLGLTFWVVVVFVYYFLATILPIDKIIGHLYPVFGAIFLFMAVGMTVMMFVSGTDFYNSAQMVNQHPEHLPIFPLVFITISCSALSGFHATQSPLMSRCMANEKNGKFVFYGSMIAEGIIGLVWATVGMSLFHGPDELAAALANGGPGKIVSDSCFALMGSFGGVLAILGVIVLPITSGDTAFRAARLTIAEIFSYPQKAVSPRLIIAVPMFAIGIILSLVDFSIIWRYFGWANQVLATIMLWASAAWLIRRDRFHWICSIPAAFMTAVCVSYIVYEPNMGLGVDITISNYVGIAAALAALFCMLKFGRNPVAGAPADD